MQIPDSAILPRFKGGHRQNQVFGSLAVSGLLLNPLLEPNRLPL